MDLYIYPEAANKRNGYSIAVDYAYNKETPKEGDVVVWLSSYDIHEMLYVRPCDYIIRRKGLLSLHSIINLVEGRITSELTAKDLSFLRNCDFDVIHCDEVIFYRALRSLFPNNHIRLRFHNCFSRIKVRNQFLKRDVGVKFSYILKIMTTLESEIFRDRNVYKIFISDEDRDFYRSTYGVFDDSESWLFSPDIKLMKSNRKVLHLDNKVTWFGGVESHKECSVRWFVNSVLPQLRSSIPDIEFHLWGKNTRQFDDPHHNIYGHGFYSGEEMPLNNSLYVNPDIIGGGVKLKLMTLMENGVPFVSTPFGFEGYERSLIDGEFCSVVEEKKWAEEILKVLNNHR